MYRNFVKKLNKFNDLFIEVEKWISWIIYAFLIFCLIYQVIARFIFKIPTAWSEEMARYSFVAVMYIACGFTLHYGKHVDMNLLDSYLNKTKNPKKTVFIMGKVTMVANLIFSSYFVSMYYPFLMKIKDNGKTTVALEIPMWIVMSTVLIGIILMAWHSLVILLQPCDEEEAKPSELESILTSSSKS